MTRSQCSTQPCTCRWPFHAAMQSLLMTKSTFHNGVDQHISCRRSPGPHSYFNARLMGLPYILFLDEEDLAMSYVPCGHLYQAQASSKSTLAFELEQMLRCGLQWLIPSLRLCQLRTLGDLAPEMCDAVAGLDSTMVRQTGWPAFSQLCCVV